MQNSSFHSENVHYSVHCSQIRNTQNGKLWLFHGAQIVNDTISMTQNHQSNKWQGKRKTHKKYKNKNFRPTFTQKLQIVKIPQRNGKLTGGFR